MLDQLHERMLREGLALLSGSLIGVDSGDDTAVTFDIEGSAWVPESGTPLQLGHEIDALWLAPAEDLERLDVPTDALFVLSASGEEVLGLAVFGAEAEKVALPGASPLFLTDIAQRLYEGQPVDLVPSGNRCGPNVTATEAENASAALLGYFELLGETPRRAAASASAEQDLVAEQLVLSAGTMIDPVTGWSGTASQQDILYQLAEGRSTDDVIIRRALPLQVHVAGDPSPTEDRVAVFVSQPTGRVLGFTVLTPHLGYDDRQEEPIPLLDRVVEIVPPEQGDDIAVYLRPMRTDLIECSQGPGEEPAMIIPYDVAAGANSRVRVDLATNTYEPVVELVVSSLD